MALNTFKIASVLGGISPAYYFGTEGQYHAGIAVDPDLPLTSTDIRTSGSLVPTVYEDFTGANVTSQVVAIVTNPKDTNTYIVLSNGRLISYDSALATETLIGTVTGGVASFAWYYNNYIYITTPTNVSRYGPLNGAAALTDSVWTGATLGTLTAPTNTTYPSIRSVSLPNHHGFIHGDGSSYFFDFLNGVGMLHRINTRRVTVEGDTNGSTVPSAYNVLDLPFGFYPTAGCSFGTDIAILAIQTTDATVNQGNAALFLWDPTNTDTFYRGPIYLADPLATAIEYVNGALFIWSGNAQNGVRMSVYAGGDSVRDIEFLEEGAPPFAGAVSALGNRIIWGGYTTYPETTACVFSYGSKNAKLPAGVHNIVRTMSAGANPNVTALKVVQQASSVIPRAIVAWRDDSDRGVDRRSTTGTYASVWRSQVIQVGKKFKVKKIHIPFGAAVAANMTIIPKVFIDEASLSVTLATINNTNNSGKRKIIYKDTSLIACIGANNLFVEIRWTGTVALPVTMPIEITLDIFEDEI